MNKKYFLKIALFINCYFQFENIRFSCWLIFAIISISVFMNSLKVTNLLTAVSRPR